MSIMSEPGFVALFMVGLLGAGHCAGMCGGIVGALSLSVPRRSRLLAMHLAYNTGRIASYTLIGLLFGAMAQMAGTLMPLRQGLYLFASIMLILLGLYLLGATQFLTPLERGGQIVWQRIQPFAQRFVPPKNIAQALLLGALWGWLPCGLVYGALASALASGSAGNGALMMLAFGLGTLPNLLLAGLLLSSFRRFAQARVTRIIAGLLVLGFGVRGLMMLAH